MQFSRSCALVLALAAAGAAAGFLLGVLFPAAPALCRAGDLTPAPDTSFLRPAAARPDTDVSGEDTAARRVCLTFDDGPSRTTPAVLEVLEQEEVPATFFVVANDSNEHWLPLIRQAQAAGHEIALHSASHKYSDIYQSPDAFWADIDLLRQRLADYADLTQVQCLRFPGGSTNTVSRKYGGDGIMKELKAEADQRGWRWVDWNVCAEDAAGEKLSAWEVYRNVTRGSQDIDRCIVLMHDSSSTATTAEALPDIIQWYKENNYTFCTVSQLYDELA